MATLGDAPWLRPDQAAASLGISRQAVQRVVARLQKLELARRDERGRWLIDSAALQHYRKHRAWPGARSVAARDDGVDWRSAAESADIRAALAIAGEHAAEIRRRDDRIELLEQQIRDLSEALATARAAASALRAEFAGVLALRVAELRREGLEPSDGSSTPS